MAGVARQMSRNRADVSSEGNGSRVAGGIVRSSREMEVRARLLREIGGGGFPRVSVEEGEPGGWRAELWAGGGGDAARAGLVRAVFGVHFGGIFRIPL